MGAARRGRRSGGGRWKPLRCRGGIGRRRHRVPRCTRGGAALARAAGARFAGVCACARRRDSRQHDDYFSRTRRSPDRGVGGRTLGARLNTAPMNRVSIYQIPVAADVLQSAVAAPSIPPALVQPTQAMVPAIAHRVNDGPPGIYVCAEDALAAARDGFATVLAKSLAAHVPSTLLVDCDFLKIGMHGLVPQPDALGFLDFLLYGSSIGVVTQDAASGVRVVGAGSFPVTKRMPFVAGAFEDASRRLVSHARCVVFAGPAVLEDGHVHPLASECDITIFVRGEEISRRPRAAAEA